MKHKRKCIEKKSFWSLEKVRKVIFQVEEKKGLRLRYYECPICLDFHLTKSKKALDADLRTMYLQGWGRIKTSRLVEKNINKMKADLKRRSAITRRSKKDVTLSLSEQKRLLRELKTNTNTYKTQNSHRSTRASTPYPVRPSSCRTRENKLPASTLYWKI